MQKTDAFTAKTFGKVVRKLRKESDITQEQLASACGMHTVYISMLERGERHPTLDKVFLIARALGIEPEYLVGLVNREL